MTTSSLSHGKSRLVSFDYLHALPAPEALGHAHKPVPHGTFVEAIREEADRRGYNIVQERFALDAKDRKMFGIMDLALRGAPSTIERGLAFGFRNSINRSMALKGVAGSRVFVCDNMTLSGDLIALAHKNTTGFDLASALMKGFDKFLTDASTLDKHIMRLQAHMITDLEAKALIFDVFAARVLPVRLFEHVENLYFRPTTEMTDCQPRSQWGVFNSMTRSVKALTPVRAWSATTALGHAFGLRSDDVIDVEPVDDPDDSDDE